MRWSNLLRAVMGMRAHPRLTSGKTSKAILAPSAKRLRSSRGLAVMT